jgi:high-affinity nickel-transport protein
MSFLLSSDTPRIRDAQAPWFGPTSSPRNPRIGTRQPDLEIPTPNRSWPLRESVATTSARRPQVGARPREVVMFNHGLVTDGRAQGRPRRGWTQSLSRREWLRLGGFASGVAFLHLLGFGLFLYYARDNPALAGLASLAYTFGLRHAFDADHIAAIDNTTRKLLQDGKRSMGVGFFFSLGHSTIVFSLAAGLAIAAKTVNSKIPLFQDYGGYIGASVSGTFLLLIGLLNLIVLMDIVGVFRRMKRGHYDEEKLEAALLNQGLMSRFFLSRVGDRIDASWKMYPLGILFGLGFDTATEIGLLALAAGVATHQVPFLAVVSLPIIFAAGMSLMDTADGAFMSHAYGWAFSNPVRKVYYNITVTSLSVAVALVIGMIELLQVLAAKFSLEGGFWTFLDSLDFGHIGYVVVGLFIATWLLSIAYWKARRIEQRWGSLLERS